MTDRINPASTVTFRDLLPDHAFYETPVEMTREEFDALPRAGDFGYPPDGWLKTGYIQTNEVVNGVKNILFYKYIEYVDHTTVNGDYGQEIRYNTRSRPVHIDGDFLIERVDR